jgi:hypothetical protein
MTIRPALPLAGAVLLGLVAAALLFAATGRAGRGDDQTTSFISHTLGGRYQLDERPSDIPNGTSTNAVISKDRRVARIIAFQSLATNITSNADSNATWDVYVVQRGGGVPAGKPSDGRDQNQGAFNTGKPWIPGKYTLVSRTPGGAAANGSSWGAAVDGDYTNPGRCVAFVSKAGNLTGGGAAKSTASAYLAEAPDFKPRRVSRSGEDVVQVAVSGGCSAVAYTTSNGKLFMRQGAITKQISGTQGAPRDPSFSIGRGPGAGVQAAALKRDLKLVFGDKDGVRLSDNGGTAKLIGAGGSDPTMTELNTGKGLVSVVAMVRNSDKQIVFGPPGKITKCASCYKGEKGAPGGSRGPVVGNAGNAVTYETDARNLQNEPSGDRYENVPIGPDAVFDNQRADVLLYTDVRKLTLEEGVKVRYKPPFGGAYRPDQSYYYNYIVFDSPAPLDTEELDPRTVQTPQGETVGIQNQVYLRYLGLV